MKFGVNLFGLVCFWVCLLSIDIVSAAEWRLHPSFDNEPVKIIDTPDNTFFLVHQQKFQKNYNGYDFPSLTLFKYSKKSPEKGIYPLLHDSELSSYDLRLVEYSPVGKYLVVAYNDGGIDIIDEDGEVFHLDKLKETNRPGFSIINSISFQPTTGDAWIGTDSGYITISALSKKIINYVDLMHPVDWVCGFRTGITVISDNAAWQCDSSNPISLSDFTRIADISSLSYFMPLTDSAFAYIQGNPRARTSLMVATWSQDKWEISKLCDDTFWGFDNNKTVVHPYEANFIPNKKGYILYSTSKVWQLYVDSVNDTPAVYSINRGEVTVPLSSWDFSEFWTYRDRGMFVRRKAEYAEPVSISGTAEWSDIGSPIRPEAPAAFIATYMDYSDKYGLLVMNHGHEWELGYNAPVNPPLLSALSSDKWKLFSQAYVEPKSVEDDITLRNIYNANINRFPLPDPNGIIIDPVNPDWISCGSMFGGIMFQDLSDIRKDVIRFGAGNDLFRQFPGFIECVPVQTWGTLSCFSPPSYDNEGVIWSFYTNAFEKSGSSPKAVLKYIKADTRKALMSSEIEKLEGNDAWGTIVLSNTEYADWNCKVVACRHENNKNIVVACSGHYDGVIYILDHKGTLEDISDDEIRIVNAVRNEYGKIKKYTRLNDLVEDPETGDIILSTMEGIIKFKPSSRFDGNVANGEFTVCNKFNDGILGSTAQVNKIIFDNERDMWIGTNNQGVLCISKDRKEIIFSYNTSNSPIPSDCVYGLGWNPESRSLMISTKLGLAEVFPDINSVGKTNNDAYVVPQSVIPGYNGYVEIRNITHNQPVRILDSTDNEIRTFSGNASNHIEWDLKDKSGTRVPAGKYYIVIGNGTPLELIVMSE